MAPVQHTRPAGRPTSRRLNSPQASVPAPPPTLGERSYTWSDERARAIELFGDTPSPAAEEEIVAVFASSPRAVVGQITSVGETLARGEIRSGWAVLRSRLAAIAA